jgi:telomerase protein component 1
MREEALVKSRGLLGREIVACHATSLAGGVAQFQESQPSFMAAIWKAVRVFISSTFRDMHAERDHLVRVVFPELRERCAKRHLHLVDVDLRWGVTEEDAQRGKALEICLHEIEDCRPFFIGLLGERYGWIPPRYDIPDEEQFDSLRGIEPGHSITAMEIYQGVLNNRQMHTHAFFYFRDPAFIVDTLPSDSQPDFRAEDDEHAAKLRQLKDRILASGLPVRENYHYDDLDALGRQVLDDLWGAIQVEYPAEAPEVDPLDAERAYHDFFIETRTELYVGQRHLLTRLHAFASADTPGPLVVTGTPGCGKSALLARFVSQFRRLEPSTFILYHFVGASPNSTDPRQMLRRLCAELARRFRFADEIPDDWHELRVRFWQFLQRAAEQTRLIVALDALNQLDETYRSHGLEWLPPVVPPGLRLILSSLEGDTLEAAQRKYEKRQDLIVTSLRLVDQGFIIARQLQQARKRLTTARKYRVWRTQQIAQGHSVPADEDRSQLRYSLTGVYSRRHEPTSQQTIQRETANPLYLHLVAEELRLFGRFDRLADFIARLPTDVPGMFQAVLERLEEDHGRDLVERSLSLVATGRHGLMESELLDLLARTGEEHFPLALWSRLYRSLAFYLKPRASVGGGDEGLIDFFHRQLAKVVHQRYLAASPVQQARHVELVAYFERKGDPAHDGSWKGNYPRSLSELTHHQIDGRLWDALEQTLTTLFYLEANVAAGRTFDLAGQFAAAVGALPDERAQHRILRLLEEALRRDIHFIHRHAQDYPQALFQCLWNTCWWYDCTEAVHHYDLSERTSKEPLPWDRTGESLAGLLRRWRQAKMHAVRNLVWLRSLRPPAIHLGTAQKAVLRGHEGRVESVAYSPDGRRIVSGGWDKTVRVWDAEHGTHLTCLRGHEGPVSSVAFLPDSRRIVSAGGDGTVRFWDAENSEQRAAFKCDRYQGVNFVAVSPEGRRIVLGMGKTVEVRDSGSGSRLACLYGHEDGGFDDGGGLPSDVTSALFLPDGRRIVSGGWDKTVRMWDAESGQQLAEPRVHEKWVSSLALSPDGRWIASGSGDGRVRVWDAMSGAGSASESGDAIPGRTSVAFSPDGQRIASGGGAKTVMVRDLTTEHSVAFRGHDEPVSSIAWSPDGRRIASGGGDGTVRLWDPNIREAQLTLRDHGEEIYDWARGRQFLGGSVYAVAFSPDGQRLVSAGDDRIVRVWDVQSGLQLVFLAEYTSPVRIAFAREGKIIVEGGVHPFTTVWVRDGVSDAALGQLQDASGIVRSVLSISADGRHIAWSSDDTRRMTDAVTGQCLEALRQEDDSSIATKPSQFPLIAVKGRLETVVERVALARPLAWFPEEFAQLATHPSGRIWAGSVGRHICLFSLEGHAKGIG